MINDERIIQLMTKQSRINIPDYLNDHNAVQRVIDSLDTHDIDQYAKELSNICNGRYDANKIFRATPRQKCEAVLRALNWLEDVR